MGSSATEGSIDLFLDSWARIGWGRLEEKVTDYRWISERRKPSGLLGRHPCWNWAETTGQCLRFFEWIGFLEVAPLC